MDIKVGDVVYLNETEKLGIVVKIDKNRDYLDKIILATTKGEYPYQVLVEETLKWYKASDLNKIG